MSGKWLDQCSRDPRDSGGCTSDSSREQSKKTNYIKHIENMYFALFSKRGGKRIDKNQPKIRKNVDQK